MKTEFEKVIIPEKVQTKAVFIAEDGTKFYSQRECEMYECSLKINNHPVFKDSKDIYTYPEGHKAKAYYFSSKDDYIFFLKSQDSMKMTISLKVIMKNLKMDGIFFGKKNMKIVIMNIL